MSADSMTKNSLEKLVTALNATNWSSWQSTARFSAELSEAEETIRIERIKDAAPELLSALQDLLNDDAKEYIPSKIWDKAHAAIAKATGGAT